MPRTASLVFHHGAMHCTRSTRPGTSMPLNSASSSRCFFASSATSFHVAGRANACCSRALGCIRSFSREGLSPVFSFSESTCPQVPCWARTGEFPLDEKIA
eukprot:8263183-Pyramimonas_sp.AAC.1